MKDRKKADEGELDYGNWVSLKLIYVPGAAGLAILILTPLVPLLLVPSLVLIAISSYFAYARHLFSPRGKDISRQVRRMVLTNIGGQGKGRGLDIGCGNGALAIMLAKAYPEMMVVGMDYWGKDWGYSSSACERNASIEGVGDRVTFQRGDAASLPFEDDSFDVVVSNFTFHEVRGVRDKGSLVQEALRVLRPGGWFSIQDLFLLKSAYGDLDALLDKMKDWGAEDTRFIETRNSEIVPWSLKLPFMLGTMGIVAGRKRARSVLEE